MTQNNIPETAINPANARLTNILSVLGLALTIIVLLVYWRQMPAEIPTHYGISGNPDGWGSKTSVLALPIISLCLFLLLTFLSRFPRFMNVPWKITEQNAQQQYELMVSLLNWVKTIIVWMFGFITWKTCLISLGLSKSLGSAFMAAPALLIVITIFYLLKMYKAR